jgi:CBS domain containing-hemolysin-like protein
LDPDSWLALIPISLCLIFLALNSAADTALTNISRLRLHQLLDREVPRAAALAQLIENPRRLPTILLLVNVVATLTLGGLATWLVTRYSHDWVAIPVLAGVTLIVLVIGVLVPRALSRRAPERAALALFPYVGILQRVLSPLTRLLDVLAAPVARLLGGSEALPGPFVTEEEMRMLVNVGEEEGVIPEEEERMITSVFAFGDKLVREVMVPRLDIVAAEEQQPLSAVTDLVLENGNTRIPVYRETIDHVIGVVNAKDLLRAFRQNQPDVPLRAILRPPYFVPETKKVDELLRELQKERVQLAIVVDEYGGTAGLVTLEDLIEEIVGEIQDEYDTESPLIEALSDHEWRCDARLPLDDANELFHTNWEAEDVDTLGGFVYSRLGHIPTVGDTVTVDNIVITVLSTEGRRLKQLLVREGIGSSSVLPAEEETPTPPPVPTPVAAGTPADRTPPAQENPS